MRIYLSPKKIHTVSVIIPMYNAEKYISECLDSLLAQTFQDFEVIVVDDCSTDSSVDIIKSYIPKFSGRLKITKTKKNSGGGGNTPRNLGLTLAQGEYIYFLDADDFIHLNALETFYNAAKEFNADTVYTSTFYSLRQPNDLYRIIDREGNNLLKKNLEDKPTLIENNPSKLLAGTLSGDNYHNCWMIFVRRELLIKNNISFPEIPVGGDGLWTILLRTHSKRFLRLPTPLVFYRRYNSDSIIHKDRSPSEQLSYWCGGFVSRLKVFNKLVNKIEFLKKSHYLCYRDIREQLDFFVSRCFGEEKALPAQDVYKILCDAFSNEKELPNLIMPILFSYIFNLREQFLDDAQITRKFKNYFNARIDVNFKPQKPDGDFQIRFVSDNRASVTKPAWIQRGGIGYLINSHRGNITFVAKATTDGQFLLNLKGLDIRDPKNKSKNLPYWIDYTKLTVNEQIVFDTLTPAWYRKPYLYSKNMKAGEEITVYVEWLPHKDELLGAPEKVPEKVPEKAPLLANKFMPYITGRIDVQLLSKTGGGDFQILSVSDDNADIEKPGWFSGGVGYKIQSCAGELKFVAKATEDGQINLKLRGLDVRDPADNSKRVPYWIDYTSLKVNEKIIFNEITPVWHNKAYIHNIDVKAGEELTLQVEWLPHKSDDI